ncbi:MAG: TonB-dependent receptor [Acidobacteriota bacterium]
MNTTQVFLLAALAAILPAALAADTEQESPPPEPSPGMTLFEETVVTARSIEEPIREVPFSLTAFESATLQHLDLQETADLFRSVPNFNYTDSGLPEANLLNIRGVGSSSTFLTPSVVYYVDGVPVQARAFDQELLDVRRLEVLRGPQGTHFGQSAQAGAVHIVTEDPTEEAELSFRASYGSFDSSLIEAKAGGRLGSRSLGRLSARVRNRDGDIDNVTFAAQADPSTDEVIRERSSSSLAGKLRIEAGPRTRIDVGGRLLRDRRKPITGLLIGDPSPGTHSLDPIPENDLDSHSVSVKVVHDGERVQLTSTTGAEEYELGLTADISDGFLAAAATGLPPFVFGGRNNVRRITEDSSQLTQELRLQGTYGDLSSWVAGLSVLRSDFTSTTDVASFLLPSGAYTGEIERTSYGVFGETTFAVGPRLRLIGGVRMNWEDSELRGTWVGGASPALSAFAEEGSADFDFLTGRLGLSRDLTDNATAYVTVARGQKAGGFPFFNQGAAFGAAQRPFGESASWSYEVGAKGGAPDGRFRYALSAFFTDTEDEQFFLFNPLVGQFQVDNADSRSYGVELEVRVRPSDRLLVSTAVGLLEAEAVDDSSRGFVRSGNAVPYAPSLTSSTALELELLDSGTAAAANDLTLRVEHQYVAERTIDPGNSFDLESYHLLQVRLSYRRGPFDIFAAADNLLDEDFVESGFLAGRRPGGSGPVIGGVPGLGRVVELGLRYRF